MILIIEGPDGAGKTTLAEQISGQTGWPIEHRSKPETPEEKLICLADKFYSKSGNMQEKSLERIQKSMQKFGPAPYQRFQELCKLFQLINTL